MEAVEIGVADPALYGSVLGYVYIFQSRLNVRNQYPILRQDAGFKLVTYDFKLENGDYFESYKFQCSSPISIHECNMFEVMNPEDSWVNTTHYQRHFSENWYSDGLHITTQGICSSTKRRSLSVTSNVKASSLPVNYKNKPHKCSFQEPSFNFSGKI